MTGDNEQLLDTLTDAWRQAIRTRQVCPPKQRAWWDGIIAGIAMSIAAASGLPPTGTTLQGAVEFGCEIAWIRR